MIIIERTHYYAKPGKYDDVVATRQKACAIRVGIGLPAGTIRAKSDPTADGPDVAWECAFASEAAHKADLDARAASPDFTAVRKQMGALIVRFERLFEGRLGAIGGWSGDVPIEAINCVPEQFSFASEGRTLTGQLWTPPGDGPFPCVVYSHGSGLTEPHEDNALPGIPVLLASWGIACFFPHRHGYGLSPGPKWRDECPGEPFTDGYNRAIVARLERESLDVRAALRFLRTMPRIDAGRLALMGSSFGGVNALLAAEAEPDVRCAVEFAGAAMNWDRNPPLVARMLAAARGLTVPIFLAQAANDFSVRPTQELAAALADAGKTHQSRIYPPFGATAMEGHYLAGRGAMLWGADVRAFLERWLA